MDFRIAEARTAKHWTQKELADRIGTTQQSIQRYEAGSRNIRASVLMELSKVLDVSVAYLLGMDEEPEHHHPDYVDVPLYGSIAAGKPIEMENTETHYSIPKAVYDRWPDAFLLRVDGESMNRILPNGCYALINPCTEIEHESHPYAICVDDREATIKRVKKDGTAIQLIPDSDDPRFLTQAYNPATNDGHTLSIVGRVVWHCIPYDWNY